MYAVADDKVQMLLIAGEFSQILDEVIPHAFTFIFGQCKVVSYLLDRFLFG